MLFKYEPDSQLTVSAENPNIFMSSHGLDIHEGGSRYILHWDGLNIGFSNADGAGGTIDNIILQDGTSVFYLNQIGVSVRGFDRPWPVLTNFKCVDSAEQQSEFLEILSDIFRIFDGSHSRMVDGTSKGKLIVTPQLQERLDSGEFLK